MAELSAITKANDLLRWLIPALDRFPRARKFTLGDRIERLALDVLAGLIEAKYNRDKADILADVNLRLEMLRHLVRLHPRKCHVRRTGDGVEFLGFRVFPTHRVPLKGKARQYLRHLKVLQRQYAEGTIPLEKATQSVMSWIGHVSFGASIALRNSILSQVRFGKQGQPASGSPRFPTKGRAVRPRVACTGLAGCAADASATACTERPGHWRKSE
jgi:hypothetical protein